MEGWNQAKLETWKRSLLFRCSLPISPHVTSYLFFLLVHFFQFCTFLCTERAEMILLVIPLGGEGIALVRLYITVRRVKL